MWEAIAALLGIVALLVKVWMSASPERRERQLYEDNQKIRHDLEAGDADAVSRRIDELRSQKPANHLSPGHEPDNTTQDRDTGSI